MRAPFQTVGGPGLAACDAEVFEHGVVVTVLHSVPKEYIEAWVRRLAAMSESRVDWHYVGGRAVVRALIAEGLFERSRFEACLTAMMPEYEALLEAVLGHDPASRRGAQGNSGTGVTSRDR